MDEDDTPRKPIPHEVGMRLDTLSIGEIEERIALLEQEILRLKQAITEKTDSRANADSFFKI